MLVVRVGVVVMVTPSPVLHAYVVPPAAVKLVLVPLQILVVPVILAVGNAFIFIVTFSLSVQPLLVAVTL